MDAGLIVGLVLSLVGIGLSMVMDGASMGALVSPSSLVMVGLGTFGITFASYRMADVKSVPKALMVGFKGQVPDPDVIITQLAELADTARRKGILAMEDGLEGVDNDFLRAGVQGVIDGLDPDAVAQLLDTEMEAVDDRHHVVISFFRSMGGFAPTMGMVGTVVGLVNMLGRLEDPSQLGAGMALALLTTLYGVLFANMVFLPIASRLTRLHETEMSVMNMVRDGVLAIQAGVSPRIIVERLEGYLTPDRRVGHKGRLEKQDAAPTNEVAA